jgi:hypothetical protein
MSWDLLLLLFTLVFLQQDSGNDTEVSLARLPIYNNNVLGSSTVEEMWTNIVVCYYVYTLNDRTRTSASAFIDLDKNDHANANIDQGESEAAVILQSSQTLEEAKQGVSLFPHGLHRCEKENLKPQ